MRFRNMRFPALQDTANVRCLVWSTVGDRPSDPTPWQHGPDFALEAPELHTPLGVAVAADQEGKGTIFISDANKSAVCPGLP